MTVCICSIDGCDGRVEARGWCNRHYQRWYRYGDPEFVPSRPIACSVEGCTRKHKGHGLCGMHLKRVRTHGKADAIGRSGRPIKGDFPGWAAIHKRLARERGPASARACVDCGGCAREWSYNGADPDQIVGLSNGCQLAYSLDLDNYEPRCPSCHRKFDNAIRYEKGATPHFVVTIADLSGVSA